jgi:signal transduction histidine kinase
VNTSDASGARGKGRGAIAEQRRATFRVVLTSIFLVTVFLAVGSIALPDPDYRGIAAVYVPLFLLYAAAAALDRAGKTRVAAFLATIGIYAMVTGAVYFYGGLSGQTAASYFIVIITAALTLGSSAAFGFTALVIVSCAWLVHLQVAGALPPPIRALTPYDHLISLTGTLALAAFLLKRALSEIERALFRATRNERENLESLRALETATRALEGQARREGAIRDLAERLLMTSDAAVMAQFASLAIASSFTDARTSLFIHVRAERTLRNVSPFPTVDLEGESIERLYESVHAYQTTQDVTLVDADGEARHALVVSLLGRANSYGVLAVFPARQLEAESELRDFVTTLGRVLGSAFERIHAERQLRESQRLESLGRLAGGIAHDFNNLLTVILGAAEVLKRTAGARERQLVADIIETSHRAADLTQQLLAFSRRDGVEVNLLELDDVIEALSRILARALGSNVELELELGAKGKHIVADRAGLEQILMNLAVNARDAMPEGGRLRIVTRASKLPDPALPGASETLILTVEDEGVGMNDEVLSRVFEPFFTTKESGEGTGLGLPTVYGIVAGLGGRVEVDSALGEGTRFRCIFPSGDDASRVSVKRRTPVSSSTVPPPGPIPERDPGQGERSA